MNANDRDTYLVGYKAIAAFLNVSVRTAKRLARRGMPILREGGLARGWVRADPVKLAAWWEARLKKN